MEQFLPQLMKEGVFAFLFVFLLWHQIQENKRQGDISREREDKLTTFLEGMKNEFTKLVTQYEKLSEDVEDIKQEIKKK